VKADSSQELASPLQPMPPPPSSCQEINAGTFGMQIIASLFAVHAEQTATACACLCALSMQSILIQGPHPEVAVEAQTF